MHAHCDTLLKINVKSWLALHYGVNSEVTKRNDGNWESSTTTSLAKFVEEEFTEEIISLTLRA